MVLRACTFETERLLVKEWHSLLCNDWQEGDLGHVIAAMLTEPVTRSLPLSWQGSYSVARARDWIKERDEDGVTLLVIDRSIHQAVGLMILFEMQSEEDGGDTDIRLGYLLSEGTWGKGMASELVNGFVNWCSGQPSISSISGGVAPDNPASKRVLEKNGFYLMPSSDEIAGGELLFRLSFR